MASIKKLLLLIKTIVVSNPFYQQTKSSLLLGMKWVFKHQDLQIVGLKLNTYWLVIFCDPHLEVGKKIRMLRFKGQDNNLEISELLNLSVCMSVCCMKLYQRCASGQGTIDYISRMIRITDPNYNPHHMEH